MIGMRRTFNGCCPTDRHGSLSNVLRLVMLVVLATRWSDHIVTAAWTSVSITTIGRQQAVSTCGTDHDVGTPPTTSTCRVQSRSRPGTTLWMGKRYNNNNHKRKNDNSNKNDDDGDRRYQDALALNRARTDVGNFLTQRAIQSFVFLLVNCRDPHTVRWIETNYGFENLLYYHGTGAFNLTRYREPLDILHDMMHQPADVIIVSAKRRGRGHGGWSKENPYLEERFVEFQIDIDPPSLASRILAVREQIAKEWMDDLETMIVTNDMILTSYHEMHRAARDEEECLPYTDPPTQQQQDDPTNISSDGNCVDIEALTAPYSDGSTTPFLPSSASSRKSRVFDRNAMTMLGYKVDFDGQSSSPLRKGSFDLLGLLCTQESIHRTLRLYREAGDEREISYDWLRSFYIDRVATHFDGSQRYGRAEDFLEDLLMMPPSMKKLSDGKMGLIDPLRIAEDILRGRSEVAVNWREAVTRALQSDHMDLRKALWVKQMEKYTSPSSTSSTSTNSSTTTQTTSALSAADAALLEDGSFQ